MKKDNTGKNTSSMFLLWKASFTVFKEDRHPHTNMAKAALNMLTHTAAGTLAKDGIL
jgi:NAD(P)-dependent dehydrogenase (short-subunit alcohol dehydrogenase family)